MGNQVVEEIPMLANECPNPDDITPDGEDEESEVSMDSQIAAEIVEDEDHCIRSIRLLRGDVIY